MNKGITYLKILSPLAKPKHSHYIYKPNFRYNTIMTYR